jgi:hypothetical protein
VSLMVTLRVLVDYRPTLEEWYVLDLTLPGPEWEAARVHNVFAAAIRAGRCVSVMDEDGERWSFLPGTVRAFWTLGSR